MSHKNDNDIINGTHNTARFFVETRHVAWVLLIATCLWGVYGYLGMPQRKDPEVQVRIAVALVPWPGASAERVEQLVTRKVEEHAAANSYVTKIESLSRTGLSVVYVHLDEGLKETAKELDDIKLRLDAIHDLPNGAGPINFIKDFGDTSALMLTVASPPVPDVELELRARSIEHQIEQIRSGTTGSRFTLVIGFPETVNPNTARGPADMFVKYLNDTGLARDVQFIEGRGFIGFDGASELEDSTILQTIQQFIQDRTQSAEFHPDIWAPVIIRDPSEIHGRLAAVAADKYSYRELDDFTDRIEKTLRTVDVVSRVSRSGVLDERVYLTYSQARLASYGIQTGQLPDILS